MSQASITFHDSRAAAFGSATTSLHDFENLYPGTFQSGPSFDDGDLTTVGGEYLFWISDELGYGPTDCMSGQGYQSYSELKFSFPSTTAFAADISIWFPGTLNIKLSNGDTESITTTGDWELLAITSTTPFSYISLKVPTSPGGFSIVNADDVEFATVPEPASMLALTLGATAFIRRRRRA